MCNWSVLSNIQDQIDLICKKYKTFVICDEHHHALLKHLGESANSAFKNARYCLVLTGTPLEVMVRIAHGFQMESQMITNFPKTDLMNILMVKQYPKELFCLPFFTDMKEILKLMYQKI